MHKGQYTRGITKQQRRERILYRMNGYAPPSTSKMNSKRKYGDLAAENAVPDPRVSFQDSEVLPSSSPHQHYEISTDVQHKIDLAKWLTGHQGDPATKVCQLSWIHLYFNFAITPYRALSLVSRIIYLHAYSDENMMVTKFHLLRRNEIPSPLSTIKSINTR